MDETAAMNTNEENVKDVSYDWDMPFDFTGTVRYPDGTKAWYRQGQRHRDNGPAIEYADGGRKWYRYGYLHRDDGPAIEQADGRRYWCRKGRLHRNDGPAIERPNGDKEWHLNGKFYGMTHDDEPAPQLWVEAGGIYKT